MSPGRQRHRGADHQQVASNANSVRVLGEVRLSRGHREQEPGQDERGDQDDENGPASRHLRPERTWRGDRSELAAMGGSGRREVGHASARMR